MLRRIRSARLSGVGQAVVHDGQPHARPLKPERNGYVLGDAESAASYSALQSLTPRAIRTPGRDQLLARDPRSRRPAVDHNSRRREIPCLRISVASSEWLTWMTRRLRRRACFRRVRCRRRRRADRQICAYSSGSRSGCTLSRTSGDRDVDMLVVAGSVPALVASRPDAGVAFGSRSAGPGRLRVQNTLVVAQIAGAMALMVTATLLSVSFVRAHDEDPGYRADGLAIVRIDWPVSSRFFSTHRIDWRICRASPAWAASPTSSSGGPRIRK